MTNEEEYHAMVHPLDADRGCGCRCESCYSREAKLAGKVPCICPECIAKDHPDF